MLKAEAGRGWSKVRRRTLISEPCAPRTSSQELWAVGTVSGTPSMVTSAPIAELRYVMPAAAGL